MDSDKLNLIVEKLRDPRLQELLEKERYEELYEVIARSSSSLGGALTELLYSAGIDPLKGLDKTPPEFWAGSDAESIAIPGGIKEIGNDTFADCHNLVTVTLPRTVIKIGRGAFASCISLKSINLPERLSRIAMMTFLDCRSLEAIEIPPEVRIINMHAFSSCKSLHTIKLPRSLKDIEAGAFDPDVYATAEWYYDGSVEEWSAIKLSDSDFKSWNKMTVTCADGKSYHYFENSWKLKQD